MTHFLILAQSPLTANAISTSLSQLYYPGARDADEKNIRQIVIPNDSLRNKSELFIEVSREIETFTGGSELDLNGLYILVDHFDFSRANILIDEGWHPLVAMLVLAFPEVHWKFARLDGAGEEKKLIVFLHSLASILHPNWNPLLDGSGLRNHILSLAVTDYVSYKLPLRKDLAAAIDDDHIYAVLHAYTAYRFGYRVYPVYTNLLAEFLFGPSGVCTHELKLTFEDVFLSFQDAKAKGYSNLKTRTKSLPALDQHKNKGLTRFFVTMGRPADQEPEGNEAFFGERSKHKLFKPLAGIFGLWTAAGFMKPEVKKGSGFVWPPELITVSEHHSSHSSPAPFKQISLYLVQRSIRLVENVKLLDDAVRGAVLASSALELLGDKEPTVANKAYELKQRFEVLAESIFGGVVFPFDMEPRFHEMNKELNAMSHWSSLNNKEAVWLNNELTIINYFIKIFDSKNELEKSEDCRHQSRTLQSRLWWYQARHKKFGGRLGSILLAPVRFYIDYLLKSIGHIITAILIWVIGLTGLYALACHGFMDSVTLSFNAFFGGTMATPLSGFEFFLDGLGIISGFFHLGILISHLYSTIVRK